MNEKDFADVPPVSADDDALFADLREVLLRHNAIDRFGVSLLHSHFEVGDDEQLVESVDEQNRVLTVRPERLNEDAAEGAVATSWRFVADDPRPVARLICWPARDTDGNIVGHMI